MSRSLHPDFREAIDGREIAPAMLLYLDFETDPVRVWTGVSRLWWAGYWWEGVGAMGALEPIEETTDVRALVVKAVLNNVPNHLLAGIPGAVWKGRRAELDLVLFEADSREVIASEPFFRGRMDTLTIRRAPESSTIEIAMVNDLIALKQTWGSNYTMESHRQLYPEDTALRFVPYIQDQKISY